MSILDRIPLHEFLDRQPLGQRVGADVRRVVISGIGLIGPTGVGLPTFWQSLLEARSRIGRITRFDPTSYPCQIGGEVHDRSYEELLDPRKLRTTAHVTQLALAATELALRHSHLSVTALHEHDPQDVGVSVGTAVGGWLEGGQQNSILNERGARRVNPFLISGAANHASGVEIANAVGAQGAQMTFSTGCPSSIQAIGSAASLIANGDLRMAVAGGAESPLSPLILAGMSRTQELCTLNDSPETASRPFDRRHAGVVLSEGSCMMILESAEDAAKRGATAYAEILACSSSCDAHGLYGMDPTGDPGARAIQAALRRADLSATEIDYVCAHANSSPAFDRKETLVLKKAFGEAAARLPVSSIKGVMGHPFGASGAFQVAAACLALEAQTIPPTANLETADPECDLDYVPGRPRAAQLSQVLITSYGYGGVNAYMILAKPRS